jgi:putative colanic acid biosysnthesis UDP-glucose lipid carrier transferase
MTSPFRLSSPYLRYLAWLLDVFILNGAAAVSAHLYLGAWDLAFDFSGAYFQMIVAASLMLGLFSDRVYRSWRVNDLWAVLGTVSWVCLMVMLLLALYLFLAKTSIYVSRIWFLIWGVGCWIGLIFQRLIIYLSLHWLRRQGFNYKTLLLVGVGPISERVVAAIDAAAWSGIRIVGVVQQDELHAWLDQSESMQPNEIWICIPMSDEVGIRQVLNTLRHSFSNIRLVPDVFSFRLVNHGISHALGMPMFDLSMSPFTGITRITKAVEDIVLSSIILLLISPIMILISLIIKITSDGPLFFIQKRLGWNGSEITVYKFRTMYAASESSESFIQAQCNDERVTTFGRFLRRTSLDELPQFINVLQGRMSIVGPRPHAIAHNEQFKELVPRYMLRHRVKPGITGWAQIHGFRGETDTLEKMESRVEYDLFYIENMSLWLDLRIIIMTIFKGFIHKNAY